MKQGKYLVEQNNEIAPSVYKAVLSGDTSAITSPGQFINIKIDGLFLRRPISVFDYDDNSVTVIYKTVGEGTLALSATAPGNQLDILTGLGNGYKICDEKKVLLVGGGVGIPPLYALAKSLKQKGKIVSAVLGFNTADEIFCWNEFESVCDTVVITTVDGSCGIKGYVTQVMDKTDYGYFYTCGPEPMLKAVYNASVTSGQFSFEERMGCGFGACMGCTCKTKYGNKRICKDGPVLVKEEIIW